MVKDICISDFDYNLPEDRIPLHPLEKRDECKLLLRTPSGKIFHRCFKELPDLVPVSSLLICNDTKVINARLQFHKDTGALIELFLLEPVFPSDYALNFQSRQQCSWKCLVGNSKKWKEGPVFCDVPVGDDSILRLKAERKAACPDGSADILFSWENDNFTFGRIIESAGKIPIPPYLNRDTEASDTEDYQTVYARVKGSVAAPTAGLHFTPGVFEGLEAHAIEVGKVTLHVGAGTFRPVKTENIGQHAMHAEPFSISRTLLEKIIRWKKENKPVIAVGTTSVRTLESLPYIGHALEKAAEHPFVINQWDAYAGENFDTIKALEVIVRKLEDTGAESLTASTSIMIAPGFNWRITDGIITNFHQPKSTLLLLVSSFIRGSDWRPMYQEALDNGYRFLSYGDASLLLH